MMKRIIILAILAITSGCTMVDTFEVMLSLSEVSLTWKGEVQMLYSPKNCQLAFNDKDIEYRVFDDNLTNWFTVKCSERPTAEGETITADVAWTGEKSIKKVYKKEFEVVKVDEKGNIWLQNDSDKIGIIIKNI